MKANELMIGVTWNKEDEENMNNILYVFNQLKDTSFYKEDDTAEKIINWLKSLKDRLYSNNEYDKDMLGAIEYCKKNNRPLEKEHLAWLEKQSEQKPAENIEIKFCEGDKIVSIQDGKVYTVGTVYWVNGDNICLHGTDGNHKWTNEDDLNKNYRLWTLKDAKDGDVLVDEDNNIGIYIGKNDDFWHSCIYLGCDGCLHGINIGAYHKHNNTKPATKEQRNLLFQKMKEAGYEWDGNKKELKKIEPKKLDADKVIAWLVANILDYEYFVKWFKKDFGL